MNEFYNMFIYDFSFKLRTTHSLKLNLACELALNYSNVDKNSVVVPPVVRGAIILDSLVGLNNIRAKYVYFSDDFKTQTVHLNLFCSMVKFPFFNFFYKYVLNDPRMRSELNYQTQLRETTTLVSLTNLNMLMKTLDYKNVIATSGIDFGEILTLKFIVFDKKKSHVALLSSLFGF